MRGVLFGRAGYTGSRRSIVAALRWHRWTAARTVLRFRRIRSAKLALSRRRRKDRVDTANHYSPTIRIEVAGAAAPVPLGWRGDGQWNGCSIGLDKEAGAKSQMAHVPSLAVHF